MKTMNLMMGAAMALACSGIDRSMAAGFGTLQNPTRVTGIDSGGSGLISVDDGSGITAGGASMKDLRSDLVGNGSDSGHVAMIDNGLGDTASGSGITETSPTDTGQPSERIGHVHLGGADDSGHMTA
ncbi:MAG: hypothetical protein AB199_02210 [Parcubacteria bacterium C7867-004]|nr:MAG: hypothetical protein AB199_02210 [Parcubacteria bacterium C7867-004]